MFYLGVRGSRSFREVATCCITAIINTLIVGVAVLRIEGSAILYELRVAC